MDLEEAGRRLGHSSGGAAGFRCVGGREWAELTDGGGYGNEGHVGQDIRIFQPARGSVFGNVFLRASSHLVGRSRGEGNPAI